MARWFVIRDGSEHGPFTDGQLKRAALAGKVRPDDLIRREDTTTTKAALEVNGLSFAEDSPLLPDAVDPEVIDHLNLESATPDAAIAACLAQKEKIQDVLLPHAYAVLGQRYYEIIDHRPNSNTPPPEVAPFVEQIDSLLLNAPISGGPGSQSQHDPVRDKAVQHRLRKKYAQLGKRAYEVGSLPQELIKEHDAVENLIQRDRVLYERITALRIELTKQRESEQLAEQMRRAKNAAGAVARNIQGAGASLLHSTPVIVLLCTLIPPLGLYLISQHPRWGIRTKIKWAGLSVAIFASLLMANHVRIAMTQAARLSKQAQLWVKEKAAELTALKDAAPSLPGQAATTAQSPTAATAAEPSPSPNQTASQPPTPTVQPTISAAMSLPPAPPQFPSPPPPSSPVQPPPNKISTGDDVSRRAIISDLDSYKAHWTQGHPQGTYSFDPQTKTIAINQPWWGNPTRFHFGTIIDNSTWTDFDAVIKAPLKGDSLDLTINGTTLSIGAFVKRNPQGARVSVRYNPEQRVVEAYVDNMKVDKAVVDTPNWNHQFNCRLSATGYQSGPVALSKLQLGTRSSFPPSSSPKGDSRPRLGIPDNDGFHPIVWDLDSYQANWKHGHEHGTYSYDPQGNGISITQAYWGNPSTFALGSFDVDSTWTEFIVNIAAPLKKDSLDLTINGTVFLIGRAVKKQLSNARVKVTYDATQHTAEVFVGAEKVASTAITGGEWNSRFQCRFSATGYQSGPVMLRNARLLVPPQ